MRTLLTTLAAALLYAACAMTPVAAEESPPWDPTPLALVLARYAVHEADFRAEGDHRALWEVLRQRAWGPLFDECLGDLRCAAERYSAGRSVRETNDRNHWVLGLNPLGVAPDGWPEAERRWDRVQEPWLDTLARAERWLEERPRPLCRYRPLHWGSRRHRVDQNRAARMLRAGLWRDADCRDQTGRPTRNLFLCVAGRCEW